MGYNVFAGDPCRQKQLERPECSIQGNIKVYVRDIGYHGYTGFNCAYNWLGILYNVRIL
jgi:hypothetical protein